MAKKNSLGTGHSWLASDAASSADSGSVDSEHSFFENQEEANKIRDSIKGVPLIGKLKKKYQYTITVVLAVMSLTGTIYTGFSAYHENQTIKEVSIAANNIDSEISMLNYQYGNYANLNDFELGRVNEDKIKIDKYISVLRANEDINSEAINKIDNYWKLQSSRFNIIDGSKDQLSKSNALLKTSSDSLKNNIEVMSGIVKNIANKSDMPAYKSIYLAQILNDMQTLQLNLNSLKSVNANYPEIINLLNSTNSIVEKKIDMLLKAGVPTDISKTLTTMQSNLTASSNNIAIIIRTISPIENALSKIKTSDIDPATQIAQVLTSIHVLDSNSVIQNYIFCLIFFALFVFFLISIFMVNARELKKDIIVAEEQKKSVENAVIRIVNDVNSIASGDYDRKVRNTTDSLIGLKDAINKLVESFVDKFLSIHRVSKELKNDNVSYERINLTIFEKIQLMNLNKTEIMENEKNINNILVELKANNSELNSGVANLLPDFIEAQNNIGLFIATSKEMDNSKINITNKHFKLTDNFNKIKEGLENLNKLCEFVEALSLNSEILHKKNLSGSSHSFNRIAEDFNKKVQEIQSQCLSMSIYIEDSKNDLMNIMKNTSDLDKHSNDTKVYLNSIKKVFGPIGSLLNSFRTSNGNFNAKSKSLNALYEKNNSTLNDVEEALRKTENSLNEFKELNKLNRLRTTDNYQNVRFIEKLNKE